MEPASIETPHAETPPSTTGGSRSEVVGNARAIALLGGAQVLMLVGGLVRWKIVAVYLGPAGVGIAGVIDQLALVALQLGSLSIPAIALRFLAVARGQGDAEFARLYRAYLTVVVVGCTVAAGGVGILFLLRPALVSRELVPYTTVFFIALATVPLTGTFTLLRNTLATLQRHWTVAKATIASAVVTAVACIIGVRMAGLPGLYLASLGTTLVISVVLHLNVVRGTPAATGGNSSAMTSLLGNPSALRYAGALYAVGFTVPLSYSMVRSSVLSSQGAEAAGYIAACYTIATGARTSFSQASLQFLTPRASRDAPKAVRAAEVGTYMHTLAIAMAIAALPVVLFPREVLNALFSSRFATAAGFLGLFLLAELMMAFGDAYRTLLLGFDDLMGYVVTTLAAPIAVMAGVYFIVPRYGVSGAGWLQIGAAATALGSSVVRLQMRHETPPDRRALLLYGAMIATVGAAAALNALLPQSAAGLVVKAIAGVMLATAGTALLSADERASLGRLLPLAGVLRRLRRRPATPPT